VAKEICKEITLYYLLGHLSLYKLTILLLSTCSVIFF